MAANTDALPYEQLQKQHEALMTLCGTLTGQVRQLQVDKQALEHEKELLKMDYRGLETAYDELRKLYGDLEKKLAETNAEFKKTREHRAELQHRVLELDGIPDFLAGYSQLVMDLTIQQEQDHHDDDDDDYDEEEDNEDAENNEDGPEAPLDDDDDDEFDEDEPVGAAAKVTKKNDAGKKVTKKKGAGKKGTETVGRTSYTREDPHCIAFFFDTFQAKELDDFTKAKWEAMVEYVRDQDPTFKQNRTWQDMRGHFKTVLFKKLHTRAKLNKADDWATAKAGYEFAASGDDKKKPTPEVIEGLMKEWEGHPGYKL